jgi:hypothetical protein
VIGRASWNKWTPPRRGGNYSSASITLLMLSQAAGRASQSEASPHGKLSLISEMHVTSKQVV